MKQLYQLPFDISVYFQFNLYINIYTQNKDEKTTFIASDHNGKKLKDIIINKFKNQFTLLILEIMRTKKK